MKNVRSSQPCTSITFVPNSVKHKFFHVSIVELTSGLIETCSKKTVDLIIIKEKYKHILQNSKVYRETTSDSNHSLLVTKLNVTRSFLFSNINIKTIKKSKKYNTLSTKLLANDIKLREQYQTEFNKCLEDIPQEVRSWEKIKNTLKSTSEKMVDFAKPKSNNYQIFNN